MTIPTVNIERLTIINMCMLVMRNVKNHTPIHSHKSSPQCACLQDENNNSCCGRHSTNHPRYTWLPMFTNNNIYDPHVLCIAGDHLILAAGRLAVRMRKNFASTLRVSIFGRMLMLFGGKYWVVHINVTVVLLAWQDVVHLDPRIFCPNKKNLVFEIQKQIIKRGVAIL